MKALEFTARVDEQHRLQLNLPIDAAPGPVRVLVLMPDTEVPFDEAEAAWAMGLAREWADDWNDPREDIYSLADGEAVHATR